MNENRIHFSLFEMKIVDNCDLKHVVSKKIFSHKLYKFLFFPF